MVAPMLRFKEFDGDWNLTNFGKVASHISYGLTIRPEYIDEGIKLISAREIASGEIDLISAPKISTDDFEKLSDKAKPQKKDLFLSKTGSIGFTAIVDTDEEFAITQNIAVIRLNDMEKQIPLFYLYQMRTSSFQRKAISVVNQSTIMDLQLGDIKKLEVSYCNAKEQTKIASFLSVVDEKISQLIQKHSLLSQYKQGMMQKLFSQQIRFKANVGSEFGEWERVSIKEAVSFIKDGTHGTHQDDMSSDLFLLSAKNLQNGHVIIDEKDRRINQAEFDSIYKNYHLKAGDILLSVVGTIGRVAIFKESYKDYAFQRSVAFMRFKTALPEFIYQLFCATNFQNELLVRQVVSAQPGIYLGDLSKIEILLPCREEQTKIANFLFTIDQKIEVVTQQIEQAKTWKKGLLQQMFV